MNPRLCRCWQNHTRIPFLTNKTILRQDACGHAQSCPTLETLGTVAHWPLSMGFSWQEYWSVENLSPKASYWLIPGKLSHESWVDWATDYVSPLLQNLVEKDKFISAKLGCTCHLYCPSFELFNNKPYLYILNQVTFPYLWIFAGGCILKCWLTKIWLYDISKSKIPGIESLV